MITHPPYQILFLDLETVPQQESYAELPEHWQTLWNQKHQSLNRGDTPSEAYARAGIYAEFGKIVCIGTGRFFHPSGTFQLKSFSGHHEKELLLQWIAYAENQWNKSMVLCAHNGREFDFPWLVRRMMVNGIEPPSWLQIMGKRPWEIPHLDTLELWKCGDYKHYTSLELLCTLMEIPSPKSKLKGDQVAETYWKKRNLREISRYCEQDVLALMRLYCKWSGFSTMGDVEILR